MASYTEKLLNLKRGQYMLYVALLFFVVIIFWVGGSLLSSQNKSEISAELRKLALPLNPNIDTQLLATIQNKRVYNESSLNNFPIYMVIRSDDGKTQQVVPIEIGRNATNTSAAIPMPIVTSESADQNNSASQTTSTSSAQTNSIQESSNPASSQDNQSTPQVDTIPTSTQSAEITE